MASSPTPAERPVPSAIERVLEAARERFDGSRDHTLGVEEEFAICSAQTLDLVPHFAHLEARLEAAGHGEAVAGELLAAEIEMRTTPCADMAEVSHQVRTLRDAACEAAEAEGMVLASSATHPWADYREQEKVASDYYTQLTERLQYVAHRNVTFGLHVHVGVHGADRAIAVHDVLRGFSPLLLALSASSPFLDGRDSGLSSARSLTFSRTFPRGNIAPIFGDVEGFLEHMRWLAASGSIDTPNQVWWGTRPHAAHGTVELRMFDGQPDVRDTLALAALSCGTVAHLCARYDAGDLPEPLPTHMVEENAWRAARWGTAADMVVLPGTRTEPASSALRRLIGQSRAAGRAAGLDLDEGLDRCESVVEAGCSATWQRAMFEASSSLDETYRAVVAATMASARAPLGPR